MNKSWFYLGIMCSLSIIVTSCGGDSGKPATTSPAASPTAASPAAATTAALPAATPAKPTDATTTPVDPAKATAKKTGSFDMAAGLIPPTDADNWTKTVSKGRTDPFAILALQPIEVANNPSGADHPGSIGSGNPGSIGTSRNSSPSTSTGEVAAKSGVNKPLPMIKVSTRIASNSSSVAPITPTSVPTDRPSRTVDPRSVDISQIPRSGVDRKLPKITVALKPSVQSSNAPIPDRQQTPAIQKPATRGSKQQPIVALKPLPQPLSPKSTSTPVPHEIEPQLARTVGVSGVIQVEGRTQVIVRLPNESFSRYVEVGDRIYDGKIKIKRIEGEQTLTPIVIFEEAGVEVTRKVGDPAGAPAPESPSK
jgi:hypothetical protein